jgi:hypothetical protein
MLALVAAGAIAQPRERVLEVPDGEPIHYRVLDATVPDADSARLTAQRMLRHLAEADIEEAALLSTRPKRRYEELARYLLIVGDSEFKRVFWQYLSAGGPAAEIAIGPHRLLIWNLPDAGDALGAQYYVDIEGRFLLDDVPNETRLRLRRVLEAYRAGKLSLQ